MNRKKILIPIIIFTGLIILLIIFLNPSHRYKKMSVSESKWESIKSVRSESMSLLLESIKFNDYNLIIDENNSTLYYSVVNDSKTKYNPNISFKAIGEKVKLAILSDEITAEKVNSNYEFKLMIYSGKEYHIYSLVCMDFPILNISYNENEKQKNIPVDMHLFNNLSNTPNKIIRSRGKLDILDNGYKLSLTMMSPGKNKRRNNISLFNMSPNDEYLLLKASDGTNEKEKEETHPVELFINNEYQGLYSLEHFKPDNVN